MAMVGALAPSFSKYLRRYFCYLAGSSDLSGINRSHDRRRRWDGGHCKPWKCGGPRVLGVDFGFDHPKSNLSGYVRTAGSAVLVFTKHLSGVANDNDHVRRFDVYGGGFGTMPAFVADYFGPRNVGPIYGLMLTAWSFASAVGPLLIAHMRQTAGSYRGALHVIAAVMAISIVLPIFVKPPRPSTAVG